MPIIMPVDACKKCGEQADHRWRNGKKANGEPRYQYRCAPWMRTKKQKWNAYQRKRNIERRAKRLCLCCQSPTFKASLCERCYTRAAANARSNYRKIRIEVLSAYGGKCTCCGEAETRFLTVDHVNNDGASRRRNSKEIGTSFYLRLRREGYPLTYQVLCYNCNCGRALNGGVCPHLDSAESAA